MSFVHLHTHTEYSLLDGAARISRLVKTAKAQGSPAVAITDHGAMYGVYKFYKEAKKAGIKPILGCEVYVVEDVNIRHPKEHRGHLVLLAKDNEGYFNLCKINSFAWVHGFYYKPRVDYKFLKEHCKGLVALSGCLAGNVPQNLLNGLPQEAKRFAQIEKDIFRDDYYIELQDHGMEEQKETNPKLINLAKELGIKIVATNDVHYLTASDAEMQDALMCVEMRKTIDDPDRMRFPGDQFYVKTAEEMLQLFPNNPEAISNTLEIAAKCDCHPFEKQDLLPIFKPENYSGDNASYFRMKIEEGLKKKYGTLTKEIKDRYEFEFRVIHDNGFVDYFLIVADFMEFANSQGIAVGPGRGSGAGSIIAYALNITLLDPLKYNLLFERFLHSERVSMPDFDLDFCCKRRDEVIQYVVNKYGQDKVAQIITFGTMAAKAAVKDIARVFKMPYGEVDKITKPMQFSQVMRPPFLPYVFELKEIKNPKEEPGFAELSESEQERKLIDYKKEKSKLEELRKPELIALYRNNPEVKKIVDMAMKVEGFPRNCSTHAAGVIICKEVVGDITPLQKNGEDVTTQFDMKECEELGMLKMDFLGLITLTDIQMTLDEIKKKLGITIDFYNMKYDDKVVFDMVGSADTDGVFQFESGGMKKFMKDLKPDCIEDFIAGVSLFRPGPMDMIPQYCRAKHKPELAKYDHTILEPILKNTYGIMVYQEQVMDIFRVLGGYSLAQADMVRRAMGKKDLKEMAEQREKFLNGSKKENITGAIANGVKKETAISIWNKMEKFAGYAFNKSHAACYAYLAYQTAYLKKHYYPYYMAQVLNNRVHKWDDMTYYIMSTRSNGTRVLPPSINKSQTYFTVEDGDKIRFGLGALKNVGIGVIESILAERERGGEYKSFQDFCNRASGEAHNKRCLESLILSGAFDEFGAARSQLMAIYPTVVRQISEEKKFTDMGQLSLFGAMEELNTDVPIPKNIKEYDEFTKLKFEKEVVGIYLSGHPLSAHTETFAQFNFDTRQLKNALEENGEESLDGKPIAMGAIITDVKRVVTKATKKEMAILSVEDIYGPTDVMIFPAVFDKVRNILEKDKVIRINGKISIREGEEPIILAETVFAM